MLAQSDQMTLHTARTRSCHPGGATWYLALRPSKTGNHHAVECVHTAIHFTLLEEQIVFKTNFKNLFY